MDGVLIIDKPENYTSHDVVARLRRTLKTKRIGHTGTLDPFATGVLVMLVGRATRLARFLDKDVKEYEAILRFGFETDTGDRTGELRMTNDELRSFSDDEFENVVASFRGEIEQTPPMYSAKKVAGKKLYELARKGVEIKREPVKVRIYELETIEPQRAQKKLEEVTKDLKLKFKDRSLRVVCSAGTYVRTLAEDIGRRLGTGAHLAELRRTRAGKFDLSRAVTLEEFEAIVAAGKIADYLISMNQAVAHLPSVTLTEKEIEDTRNGKKLPVETGELADNETTRMIDVAENLIAIGFYKAAEKSVQPKLVLL